MVQSHIDEGMLLDAMEEEVRERGVATVYMCLEGAELISGVLPKDMCGFRWMLTEDLNFTGRVSQGIFSPSSSVASTTAQISPCGAGRRSRAWMVSPTESTAIRFRLTIPGR